MSVERKGNEIFVNGQKISKEHGYHCSGKPKFFIIRIVEDNYTLLGCASTLKDARIYLEYIKHKHLSHYHAKKLNISETFIEHNNHLILSLKIGNTKYLLYNL